LHGHAQVGKDQEQNALASLQPRPKSVLPSLMHIEHFAKSGNVTSSRTSRLCIPAVVTSIGGAGIAMLACMFVMVSLFFSIATFASNGSVSQESAVNQTEHRKRLNALDGMRVVCITYVLFGHHACDGLFTPFFTKLFTAHESYMQYFFVLSGFMGCYVAEAKVKWYSARTGAAFFARRLARLLPSYYVGLLIMFAIAYVSKSRGFITWPLQALCIQASIPVAECGCEDTHGADWSGEMCYVASGGNNVGWFTSVIVVCSALFPLLFTFRPQSRHPLIILTLLAIVLAARTVPALLHGHLPNRSQFDLYVFAPLRLLEFIAGMLAAQLYNTMPPEARSWAAWGWVFDFSLVLAFIVATFIAPMGMRSNGHVVKNPESHGPPDTHGPPQGDFFLTGLWCLVCIAARGAVDAVPEGQPVSGFLCRMLGTQPLVCLAESSYGAYVLQTAMLLSLRKLSVPNCILWPTHVLVTWSAAIVTRFCVEAPVVELMERLLNKRAAEH
jgi:peptidoglycan/LPS O-acetylase OafA/YrhL